LSFIESHERPVILPNSDMTVPRKLFPPNSRRFNEVKAPNSVAKIPPAVWRP
jgi:hypothetical protein